MKEKSTIEYEGATFHLCSDYPCLPDSTMSVFLRGCVDTNGVKGHEVNVVAKACLVLGFTPTLFCLMGGWCCKGCEPKWPLYKEPEG